MPIASSTGIASGLDVDNIINQLMSVEKRPLAALAQKEAAYQAKLSAYGTLKSAVSAFESAMEKLGNVSTFASLKTSVSDSTVLSATNKTDKTDAIAGNYLVNVKQMAQAQTLSSASLGSKTASIGSGATTTISFQFGTIRGGTLTNGVYSGATFTQNASKATGSITIDNTNNSLQGIRDAINAADMGVVASLVSESDAASQKLVLSSGATGEATSMKITVEGDSTLQDLLGYDPAGTQHLTQYNAAQDAKLTVNGMPINSASNTVSEAIQGITIEAKKVGQSHINITKDTSSIETGIRDFVKAHNDLHATLETLTAYNAQTRTGGALLGDTTARTVGERVRKMLSTPLKGVDNATLSLPRIGVAFQKDGSLAVDAGKLNQTIQQHGSALARLFATTCKTTDSLITFADSSTTTRAGSYDITVTRTATRATLTGNIDLTGNSIQIAPGTSLGMTVDGINAQVSLAEGSYNAKQFAAMLQSAINGTSNLQKTKVSVSASVDDNGHLNLVSNRYGSSSSMAIHSSVGTPVSLFLGINQTRANGVDVAGTIGGKSATGSGQFLTGAAGTDMEGLKLEITGGTVGKRGHIDFSHGYADLLQKTAHGFTDTNGLIGSRTHGIEASIKDIGKQSNAFGTRLANTEARYRAQFMALEVMISNMNATSNFLKQQLAQLSVNPK